MTNVVTSSSSSSVYVQRVDDLFSDRHGDGFFTESNALCDRKDWIKTMHSGDVEPTKRAGFQTTRRLGRAMLEHDERERCRYCWLYKGMCLCPYLEYPNKNNNEYNVRFTVFMSPKEFLRTSNSGRVLGLCLGSEILVNHVPSHVKRLQEIVNSEEEEEELVCVLYPSDDATVTNPFFWCDGGEQFCAIAKDAASEANRTFFSYRPNEFEATVRLQPPKGKRRLNVILLDGTWNEAKTLNAAIPRHVPRVKIAETVLQHYTGLFSPLRNQTRATGVSTCEAAVLFLRHLGCPETTLVEPLFTSFRRLVDAVCLESRGWQEHNSLSKEYETIYWQSQVARHERSKMRLAAKLCKKI
eukprot:PhM_4_TR11808/c1_g1_i1/m.4451